jgi:hypothetical protein
MQLQITLASAATAMAITPATTQQMMPIATRITELRSRVVMDEE